MSKLAVYGAVVAVPTVVQVFAPVGETWKSTWSTPEPATPCGSFGSAAVPLSVIVDRRNAPGSSCAVTGCVLSIFTFATVTEVVDVAGVVGDQHVHVVDAVGDLRSCPRPPETRSVPT